MPTVDHARCMWSVLPTVDHTVSIARCMLYGRYCPLFGRCPWDVMRCIMPTVDDVVGIARCELCD